MKASMQREEKFRIVCDFLIIKKVYPVHQINSEIQDIV